MGAKANRLINKNRKSVPNTQQDQMLHSIIFSTKKEKKKKVVF
jgi:hypothetical protein